MSLRLTLNQIIFIGPNKVTVVEAGQLNDANANQKWISVGGIVGWKIFKVEVFPNGIGTLGPFNQI